MFLASKIEEMYTPEIGDFVYITDNAYSASMIRSLETKMAKLLGYNFGDPLCIHFLRRDSKAAKVCMSLVLRPNYNTSLSRFGFCSLFKPTKIVNI